MITTFALLAKEVLASINGASGLKLSPFDALLKLHQVLASINGASGLKLGLGLLSQLGPAVLASINGASGLKHWLKDIYTLETSSSLYKRG